MFINACCWDPDKIKDWLQPKLNIIKATICRNVLFLDVLAPGMWWMLNWVSNQVGTGALGRRQETGGSPGTTLLSPRDLGEEITRNIQHKNSTDTAQITLKTHSNKTDTLLDKVPAQACPVRAVWLLSVKQPISKYYPLTICWRQRRVKTLNFSL